MNRIIAPEDSISIPDLPKDTQLEGGILVPDSFREVSGPKKPAKILKPKGHSGGQSILAPKAEDVTKYTSQKPKSETPRKPSGEIAQAFGNFEVYFARQVRETFPSHTDLLSEPSILNYERFVEEKPYYDKNSGTVETRIISRPGLVEEECIVAIRIAEDPHFAGTAVAYKALDRATTLIAKARALTEHDEVYSPHLLNMPDLVFEIERYLQYGYVMRRPRVQLYDLLNEINIPQSETAVLGDLMTGFEDLNHSLAYRLLCECSTDSAFYLDQAARREKMLGLLKGDAQQVADLFHQLQELSKGLVCSMNVQSPPNGRVGVEIEFGWVKPVSEELPRFNVYTDPSGNREVSRNIHFTALDRVYLKDLDTLTRFLREGSTHVSSLHLHLDRDQHPNRPELGSLLGNLEGRTIEKSSDKRTWEVRGILPPSHGNKLDPSGVANIIQFYIAASTESSKPQGLIKLPDGLDPSLQQIIFAHICRFTSSPETRLAALKILEHPLSLTGVNPDAIMESFETEDREKVFKTLKENLVGRFAKRAIRKLGYTYGYENRLRYERLTEEEILVQYEGLLEIFKRTGLLENLETGEFGIRGIDDKKYPIPSREQVTARIREHSEVLGPKMEQGFRKLILVPFGMSISQLSLVYAEALRQHHNNGRLMAAKSDVNSPDTPLDLNTNAPIHQSWNFDGSDTSGKLVYYPDNLWMPLSGTTKMELLREQGGWNLILVEDLITPPRYGDGERYGGRLQLETNFTPRMYHDFLKSNTSYLNEVGFTPEDWLTLALLRLEETDQVLDDVSGYGNATFLLGAVFTQGHLQLVQWLRDFRSVVFDEVDPEIGTEYYGVRTAVRVRQ